MDFLPNFCSAEGTGFIVKSEHPKDLSFNVILLKNGHHCSLFLGSILSRFSFVVERKQTKTTVPQAPSFRTSAPPLI